MPHPRKLLIEFASGSKLKTLKVYFEHGLDWMKQVKPAPKGPFVKGPFYAEETYVLVHRDESLSGERAWSW